MSRGDNRFKSGDEGLLEVKGDGDFFFFRVNDLNLENEEEVWVL